MRGFRALSGSPPWLRHADYAVRYTITTKEQGVQVLGTTKIGCLHFNPDPVDTCFASICKILFLILTTCVCCVPMFFVGISDSTMWVCFHKKRSRAALSVPGAAGTGASRFTLSGLSGPELVHAVLPRSTSLHMICRLQSKLVCRYLRYTCTGEKFISIRTSPLRCNGSVGEVSLLLPATQGVQILRVVIGISLGAADELPVQASVLAAWINPVLESYLWLRFSPSRRGAPTAETVNPRYGGKPRPSTVQSTRLTPAQNQALRD